MICAFFFATTANDSIEISLIYKINSQLFLIHISISLQDKLGKSTLSNMLLDLKTKFNNFKWNFTENKKKYGKTETRKKNYQKIQIFTRSQKIVESNNPGLPPLHRMIGFLL